ncbi:MAG TPA: non-heme iron oxygenase ferredoxin subunit [Actinomycetota bacterium]
MRERVGAAADLKPGGVARVVLDGHAVAVFNVDGSFYAVSDTCTHEESSLADGYIEDDIVECAKHGAMFHIPTGEVRSLPATRSLRTFRTTVEGDDLYVEE